MENQPEEMPPGIQVGVFFALLGFAILLVELGIAAIIHAGAP